MDNKGLHVTSQLNLFNLMIETRILIQKIVPSNKNSSELHELIQTFLELKKVPLLQTKI